MIFEYNEKEGCSRQRSKRGQRSRGEDLHSGVLGTCWGSLGDWVVKIDWDSTEGLEYYIKEFEFYPTEDGDQLKHWQQGRAVNTEGRFICEYDDS